MPTDTRNPNAASEPPLPSNPSTTCEPPPPEKLRARQLRALVRGGYDLQKLRIQMGNRITTNFRVKLGQKPSKPSKEMSKEAQLLLRDLMRRQRRLADAIINSPSKKQMFVGDEVISSEAEFTLVSAYMDIEKNERRLFTLVEGMVNEHVLWNRFLIGVRGVGPMMAGVILSEIDIAKSKHVSNIWSLAGLDVAGDGRGRSRRKEHLVEREYTDSAGRLKKRMSITFNPWLKTKLMGVLATSFLRARDNPYAEIYNNYKHRLEHHATYSKVTKLHRHNMALRYMIKCFLRDLYCAWRPLEGLPVSDPYSESKLGMAAHGS